MKTSREITFLIMENNLFDVWENGLNINCLKEQCKEHIIEIMVAYEPDYKKLLDTNVSTKSIILYSISECINHKIDYHYDGYFCTYTQIIEFFKIHGYDLNQCFNELFSDLIEYINKFRLELIKEQMEEVL